MIQYDMTVHVSAECMPFIHLVHVQWYDWLSLCKSCKNLRCSYMCNFHYFLFRVWTHVQRYTLLFKYVNREVSQCYCADEQSYSRLRYFHTCSGACNKVSYKYVYPLLNDCLCLTCKKWETKWKKKKKEKKDKKKRNKNPVHNLQMYLLLLP